MWIPLLDLLFVFFLIYRNKLSIYNLQRSFLYLFGSPLYAVCCELQQKYYWEINVNSSNKSIEIIRVLCRNTERISVQQIRQILRNCHQQELCFLWETADLGQAMLNFGDVFIHEKKIRDECYQSQNGFVLCKRVYSVNLCF